MRGTTGNRRPIALSVAALAAGATLLVAGCGQDEPSQTEARLDTTAPQRTTPSTSSTPSTTTAPQRDKPARKGTTNDPPPTTERDQPGKRKRKAPGAKREAPAAQQPSQPAPEQPAQAQAQAPEPEPPRTDTMPAQPPVRQIAETASLTLVRKNGLRFFVHSGPIRGQLNGEMTLRARLGGPGVTGTFIVNLPDGAMHGRASGSFELKGTYARFEGKAEITGGTGTYHQANAPDLRWKGRVATDGSRSKFTVTGALRY